MTYLQRGRTRDAVNARVAARTTAALVLLLLALRLLYAATLRVNSDEPQHLHVVWAWTRGLLPYRDVFDNHAPLFQLLAAPLLALVGEHDSAIVWMRVAMIPWYAIVLACTWTLAAQLFDRRVAAWSTMLTAVLPVFFVTSTQFRPDVAWAALWMAMLCVAFGTPLTPRRAGLAALLGGAMLAVSLKSVLLLGGLVGALATVGCFGLASGRRVHPGRWWPHALAAAAGLALVPSAFCVFFASQGAWDAFVYGIIGHNVLPGLGRWSHGAAGMWIAAAFLLPAWAIAHRLLRTRDGLHRATLLLTCAYVGIAVTGFWPLYTHQDLLPFIPLALIFACAAAATCLRPGAHRIVMPAVLALEVIALVLTYPPDGRSVGDYRAELRALLRLTDADDYVMDAKGQSIFRHRPYYYALESITRERLRRGLLPDDVAARMAAHGTPVVFEPGERLAEVAHDFIERNYLAVTPLIRVLGQRLDATGAGVPRDFVIAVPSRYDLVSACGPARGVLDGTAFTGPRELAAGPHRFVSETDCAVAVVWGKAVERGFAPSALASADAPLPPSP